MKRMLRIAIPALLLTASMCGALAGNVTIAPPNSWPKTDVAPDASITFGTLPNGMRYLIKPNKHPEHAVSFYMRIATGSVNEKPEHAGIAHFIEHMIFRGTTHFPDGEVIKQLQSRGLAHGADSNAYTGGEATVYTFDFPANDAKSIDTALTLTRDIASDVLFDQKTVDSERQVVLSELRLRDTPQLRMALVCTSAVFGDKLADALFAIGTQDTLNNTTADDLRDFYRTNYRPERAVLIVVGDVDPKVIESEIKTRFASWKASTPKPKAPTFDIPDPPKTVTPHIYAEAGANSGIELAWMRPYDPSPDTKAREARDAVRSIAMSILNLRLHKLAYSPEPPFIQAGSHAGNSARAAFIARLGASVGTGDHKRAIRALHETLAITLRDGVTQDEVNRAIEQQRSSVATSVAAAPTRTNRQLESSFVNDVGNDSVIDGPETWENSFEDAVKSITAERVNTELRALFSDREPLLIASSQNPIDGGSAALLTAYNDSATPAASAHADTTTITWPYTDFGTAGTIKNQKIIEALGATQVLFANGVRATIKPTKYQQGQLQILVKIGHGRLAMPKDRLVPRWAIPGVWALGGLKRIGVADMPQALNGKQWGAVPDVADGAFQLQAHTKPADFITELQLLTAYVNDPALRPEALEKTRSSTETWLEQSQTTPGGVYGLHYWEYLHNNDKRWSPPEKSEIKTTDLASVTGLFTDDLKNGPLEVIVVGDITVAAAIDGLKQTFGALGSRKVDTSPYPAHEKMPKTGLAPQVFFHKGKTQEAIAMLGWKTTGLFPSPQTARILHVLQAVMRTRLYDEVRTKEGLTYSPSTASNNSWTTPDWGILSITATVPAAKLSGFYAAAKKVASDLATKPIEAEELERARGPMISDTERARETNGHWVGELSATAVDPRAIDLITDYIPGLKRITSADIQKAAQTYLKDERSLRMIVAPEGFAVPTNLP